MPPFDTNSADGYLRITQFQERTDTDLQKAMTKMQDENSGPISGLVLDLRNNPGGLLNQAGFSRVRTEADLAGHGRVSVGCLDA